MTTKGWHQRKHKRTSTNGNEFSAGQADPYEGSKIVKGGDKFSVGILDYRTGYDIRKRPDGKYFVSVMNGPFEIFRGDIADDIITAELKGLEDMLKNRAPLARNVGVSQELIDEIKQKENSRIDSELRAMNYDGEVPPGVYVK